MSAGSQCGVDGLPGPGQKNLIDIEEGQQSNQEDVQRKQQMLMQEEYDIEQLQERQRAINQLEVFNFFVVSYHLINSETCARKE